MTLSWYVHITRAERGAEAEQHPITREEWLACVEADAELRRVTPQEVEEHKPFVKADDAAWIEPDGGGRVLAWFGWHKGLIDVRNPHAETLCKVVDVAERLKANVLDENDNLLIDPGPPQPTWRDAPPARRVRGGGGGRGGRGGEATAVPVGGIVGIAIVLIGVALLLWLLLRD